MESSSSPNSAAAAAELLRVENLSAAYGAIEALRGASLAVAEGEFVAILGPNGAGKSTLLKAIMRLIRASGRVTFRGELISARRSDEMAALGIAYVPEGRGILAPMTVRENLDLGAYARMRKAGPREIAHSLEAVFALFPRLSERQQQRAGSLSGGEQQILALGRAMMTAPRLLVLDEPSLGLAPRIAAEVFQSLEKLNRNGLSILLVEQKAPLALKLATRAHVMRGGRFVDTIDPRAIASRDELARYYLGSVH